MESKKPTFFGLNVDSNRTPFILVFAIFGLWLACWILVSLFVNDWSERGQFGDMFGAVNALFSGLAFGGIIYTILLQREELNAQRKELELTRLEFKEQNETLRLQRFENVYFNLLTIHYQLVENLTHKELRGRIVLMNTINQWNDSLGTKRILEYKAEHYEEYLRDYQAFIFGHQYYLSHYVQSIKSLY